MEEIGMSLRGLEIVVVGGSGGLGAASTDLLAAEGAKLIVSYSRNEVRARHLVSLAKVVRTDITEPNDRTRLLDLAPELYGLVVFAGIPARSEDHWDESLRVNYSGPIHLAREAAARMKEKGTRGSIVLIGTMLAVGLFPNSTAYAGPKAAMVHAARILAKEMRGPQEVRVNIISPGVMNAGMGADSVKAGKYARFLDEGSVPRWGEGADIARALRLFLEPDNYITGQHLLIDGGLNL
jgi:NAD(P)-dependent dehydrogenase (short-subunit alcohol dehydrogenase family)